MFDWQQQVTRAGHVTVIGRPSIFNKSVANTTLFIHSPMYATVLDADSKFDTTVASPTATLLPCCCPSCWGAEVVVAFAAAFAFVPAAAVVVASAVAAVPTTAAPAGVPAAIRSV